MRSKNIVWGVVLLTLGVLFILRNLGVFYFNWFSLFRLWPVLLLLIGISLLPLRNGIKVLLSIASVVVMASILVSFPGRWNPQIDWKWDNTDRWENNDRNFSSRSYYDREQQDFHEPFDSDIDEATLIIDAIAGEFVIDGISNHLIEFEKDGNIGPYIFSSKQKGDKRFLSLSLKEKHFRVRHLVNDVEMRLNTSPIWNFDIETGAARLDLDLSKFEVGDIQIDGGASSVYIKLGKKNKNTSIDIDSGASAITIKIPEEMGCEIDTDTFLSSKDFDGFRKLGNGEYETPNYRDALKKIHINIDAAITSLKIIRY